MGNSKFTDISDKKFLISTMNFYNNCKSSDVNKMDDLGDLVNSLVADTVAGTDGQYRDEDNTPGLKHLYADIRWKKLLSEDYAGYESIDVLSYISSYLRQDILDKIVDIYSTKDLAEDRNLKVPKNITSWSNFLRNGYTAKKNALREAQQLKNSFLRKLDVKDFTNRARIVNEISKIDDEINQLETQQNTDIENFKKRIKNDLELKAMEYVRSGYLYVFIKSSDYKDKNGNTPYTQTSLYKEYKIDTQDSPRPIYNEIILDSHNIGLDDRNSEDSQVNKPAIPAVYIDENKQQHPVETRLLFSEVQLSWARLAKLAGIDKSDERAKDCQNENFDKCTRASQIESYKSPIKQSRLKTFYNLWLTSDKSSYYNNQQNNEPLTKSDLEKEDLYFKLGKRKNYDLNLLVDDPFGMVMQYALTIADLRVKLKNIVEELDTNTVMKSALMTYQTFFNPRAMQGIDLAQYHVKVNDILSYDGVNISEIAYRYRSEWEAKSRSYNEIQKGRKNLDKSKLEMTLKKNTRGVIKKLIEQLQIDGLEFLKDQKDELTDFFSQGELGYASVHADFWGKLEALTQDPSSFDDSMEISNLPVTTLNITDSPNITATLVEYNQTGFHVEKKTTTYNLQRNQRSDGMGVASITESTDIKYEDCEEEYQAKLPKAYVYLMNDILTDDDIVDKLLPNTDLDSDNLDSVHSQGVIDNLYRKADGAYNGGLLHQATEKIFDIVDDQFSFDKDVSLVTNFINGFSSAFLKAPNEILDKSNFPDRIKALSLDALKKKRSSISKRSAKENSGYTSMVTVVQGRYNQKTTDKIARINRKYKSKGNVKFKVRAFNSKVNEANAINNLKVAVEQERTINQESLNASKKLGERSEGYSVNSNVYKKIKGTNGLFTAKELNSKQMKMLARAHIFEGVLSSMLAVKSIADIKKSIESDQKDAQKANRNNNYTTSDEIKSYVQCLKYTTDFVKAIADNTQTAIAINNKINGYYMLAKGNNVTNYDKFAKYIKDGESGAIKLDKAVKFLALLSTSLSLVEDFLTFIKHAGQNDQAVAASDLLNLLSSGFAVASAVKEVTEKVGKKVVVGIGGAAEKEAVAAGFKVAATEALAGLAVRQAILGLIPIVNILSLLALACQIGSWILLLFKDNIFEQWAKASRFAND